MSSFYDYMMRSGMTNAGQDVNLKTGDFNFTRNEYKFIAHCTSNKCNGYDEYGSKVKKEAKLTDVDCRDCGSVLYWEKIKI